MEGLTVRSYAGDITMRASDHQLQQSLFFATWQKVDAKQSHNVEGTGNTFGLTKMYPSYVAATPTSCQMKRP
jgi:branched-chain amino acid transport system substrate-binding protein